MPDLTLTDDSKQYQDLARDFAKNEIAPHAHAFDISGEFPLDICKKAWEIGLINVRIPEAFGGLGLGVGDACVIAEEIGAACAGIGAAVWGNDLAVAPVLVAGNQQQQQRLLEPLLAQFALAGYCFWQTNAHAITYEKSGGGFKLNGSASAINAGNAGWFFLVAQEKGGGATTAFAVPASALTIKERVPALGLKAADVRTVQLTNAEVKPEDVVGEVGSAEKLLSAAKAISAPIIGSYAAGLLRAALENSVQYSKERQTMGVPIARHQAVGFMMADIAKDLEAARYLLRKAAWMCDNGNADVSASVLAKTFACDAAMKGTVDAVQVYGGYGYSREYPVEKLMRDAKMMQVYEYGGTQAKLELGKQLVGARR